MNYTHYTSIYMASYPVKTWNFFKIAVRTSHSQSIASFITANAQRRDKYHPFFIEGHKITTYFQHTQNYLISCTQDPILASIVANEKVKELVIHIPNYTKN